MNVGGGAEHARRNIVVVGNYEPDHQHSMLQYNDMLLEACRLWAQGSVRLARPEVVFGRAGGARLKALASLLDKYVLAPFAFPSASLALIGDQGLALYTPFLRARRKVIVCHDLIAHLAMARRVPGWRPSRLGRLLQRANLLGLKRADHVVCISEATRRDFLDLTGASPDKVSVIRNCLPPAIVEMATAAPASLSSRNSDVLCFATSFYKNAELSVKAFAQARPRLPEGARLLVVGLDTEGPRALARTLGVDDAVVWLGRVSSEALHEAYRGSGALLFPSLYEGFGWPVLEAQAFNLPVVTSDAASLPEVAGEGALVCSLDAAALAEALVRIFTDRAFATMLVARGQENLKRFDKQAWLRSFAVLLEGQFAKGAGKLAVGEVGG